MLCHLSSSKAVGHPLTACLVERYVIRTSYSDNASSKYRRNTALFFLYVSKKRKIFFAFFFISFFYFMKNVKTVDEKMKSGDIKQRCKREVTKYIS